MATETQAKVVTWFEIPSTDFDRAVGFYEALTGTTLRREEFGGTTLGIFPCAESGVTGAVMPPGALSPSPDGLNLYLWIADDMDAALERALAHGGRIADPKMQLPGDIGWVAHIIDSEGNRIGLHASH